MLPPSKLTVRARTILAAVTELLLSADRRSYYAATLRVFCADDCDEILARMARQNDFDLVITQRDAWLEQASILQRALARYAGSIYLEFTIPRMGRRIDAVVIIGPVIFVLEFKVGATAFHAQYVDQVIDYALDLRNFHEGSHDAYIAPVLICTEADPAQLSIPNTKPDDHMFDVAKVNAADLRTAIEAILRLVQAPDIQIGEWEASRYKPTPTIIEATLAVRGESP